MATAFCCSPSMQDAGHPAGHIRILFYIIFIILYLSGITIGLLLNKMVGVDTLHCKCITKFY